MSIIEEETPTEDYVFDDMSGISIASGFKLHASVPLDARCVVDEGTDLDKLIAENGGYEGMVVYVKETALFYQYVNGKWEVSIKDWLEIKGNITYKDISTLYEETALYNFLAEVNYKTPPYEDDGLLLVQNIEQNTTQFLFTAYGEIYQRHQNIDGKDEEEIKDEWSDWKKITDDEATARKNADTALEEKMDSLGIDIYQYLFKNSATVESCSYDSEADWVYVKTSSNTKWNLVDVAPYGSDEKSWCFDGDTCGFYDFVTNASYTFNADATFLVYVDGMRQKFYILPETVTLAQYIDACVEKGISEGKIIEAMLANNSVTDSKIKDSAVTTAKIKNKSITTEKLADASVTADKIKENTISFDLMTDTAISEGIAYSLNEDSVITLSSCNVSGSYYYRFPSYENNPIFTLYIDNMDKLDTSDTGILYNDDVSYKVTGVISLSDFAVGMYLLCTIATAPVTGADVSDGELRVISVLKNATASDNLIRYSTTPQQIGYWIDGTPIWRQAFKVDFSEEDKADIAESKDYLIDPSTTSPTGCFVINAFGNLCAGDPCVVDDINCTYTGDKFIIPETALSNITDGNITGIYGWFEFVAPKSIVKTT